MEVYVYKNPTCFSRWSLRVGKKLKLYKYGYGEDYTYIEGTIESVHKDYFCLDVTEADTIYRVGSINMLNYSSFPDYYDSVEIIEDNNE